MLNVTRVGRRAAGLWCLAAVLAVLSGCAGDSLHRDGIAALAAGKVEEGLSKLAAASQAEPDNLEYRGALLRNRELVVSTLATTAANDRSNARLEAAQAGYERILRIDPENGRARDGLNALAMDKRHAGAIETAKDLHQKGETKRASLALKPVLLENPKNGDATQLLRQIEEQEARALLAEPLLEGKFKKPVTLQFRDANLKMVLEALSRTGGINILLDKDVKPDLKTSIFVKDVSVEDTINLILLQSQLEKKVLSENTVFVYPSTPAKLKDYQELKVRSFHLNSADPKQMLTMLKTLLKTKDVFVHEKTNSIVMRDTPDAIRLAERMIADQDFEEPEVMLEVEVLEVAHERLTDIGLKFPDQLGLTVVGGTGPGGALTVEDLRHINGSKVATSPALSVTANLKLQDSDTNVLASPRIRAKNREKAKIMIGDRVPVITNAITPVSTGTPVVTGNVQYLDVGLKLEVEPDIHPDGEVVIKVNLDVSSIIKEVQNAQSGTLAYQIGTRNAATVLRLKDGETQILAGLINRQEQNSAAKVPGLGQIPVLGRLFSDHRDDSKKTEIVLSITPRIIGTPHAPKAREVEYWSGTENGLKSELMTLRGSGVISQSGNGEAAWQGQQNPSLKPAAAAPVAAATVVAPAVAAPEPPVVLSWQGPERAKIGEVIKLSLEAQADQAIGGIGFVVGYDPKVLKAIQVDAGGFLKQGNTAAELNSTVDVPGGRIQIAMSAVAGAAGATGSGSIAMMQFEVVGAAPASQITVSGIAPAAANGEILAATAPRPHALAVLP